MSANVRHAAFASLLLAGVAIAPQRAYADVDPGPEPIPAQDPPAPNTGPATGADPSSRTPTDASGNARADDGTPVYFRAPTGKDIVIHSYPDRTTKNIAILSGIAGAGALVGALGLYYNLDARDAANQVSAKVLVHEPWTPARQALADRADSSSTKAEVAYGVGGALVIGAIVALIVTAPAEETTIIHPHIGAAPVRGGASMSAAWSF